jgi:hypothetical protein
MATLPASNSFEGGTAGSAITAASSGGASGTAFDALVGGVTGVPTYDASHPMHGGLSFMCNFTGVAGATQLAWTGLNRATLWGRFYLLFAAWPNVSSRQVQIMDTAVAQGSALIVGSNGKIAFRSAANTQITASLSTTVLNPLVQYRIEWAVTTGAGTGTCEWHLFLGDSPDPIERNLQTGQTFTANNFDAVRYGQANDAAIYQFWIDDPAVDAIGFPGPSTIPYPAIQTWPGAPLAAHWYGTTWNPI